MNTQTALNSERNIPDCNQLIQQGFTLIEVSLALILTAVIAIAGINYFNFQQNSKALHSDASQLLELSRAAEAFAKARRNEFLSASPAGIDVNTYRKILISDLKNDGYLPADFPNTLGNSEQQFEIRFQHIQTQEMANQSQNLRQLVTWVFTSNGDAYTQGEVSELTKNIGSDAGYIPAGEKYILGIGSSWRKNNSIGLQFGHPVIRLISTQIGSTQNRKWGWVNARAERKNETQYRNTSGEPIMVSIASNNAHSFLFYSKCSFIFTGIESNLKRSHSNCAIMNGGGHARSSFFLVEAKKSYAFAGHGQMNWYEYRPLENL